MNLTNSYSVTIKMCNEFKFCPPYYYKTKCYAPTWKYVYTLHKPYILMGSMIREYASTPYIGMTQSSH